MGNDVGVAFALVKYVNSCTKCITNLQNIITSKNDKGKEEASCSGV